MEEEEWRVAPQLPSYEVSSLGRVRRRLPGPSTRPGRLIAGWRDRHGYAIVQSGPAAARTRFYVHQLVCRAFHGEQPAGYSEVNHINFEPGDNRAENLEWASRVTNLAHTRAAGRHAKGESHGQAKLNLEAAKVVRYLLGQPHPRGLAALLARLHGVSGTTVHMIAHQGRYS